MKKSTKVIISILLFFGILLTLCCCSNPERVSKQMPDHNKIMESSATEETKSEKETAEKETDPQKEEEQTVTQPSEDQKPTETSETPPAEQETQPHQPENYNLSWTPLNKTMYAHCLVNVRSGPGIDYERLGSLYVNDQVQAIRQASNGWTEIEWDNGTAFVFSNYISSEKVKPQPYEPSTPEKEQEPETPDKNPEETPEEPKDPQTPEYDTSYPGHDGVYMGQLVSSLGFNIRLYKKGEVSSAQAIVDAPNSANYRPYRNAVYIADHKHQDNFSAIKNAVPGQSTFQIIGPEGTWTYICTDILMGHNTGSTLTDEAGNDMLDGNHGELIMYTCNDNWRNVTLTVWKRIS